jgi:flagellar hook assembly protein FlgD
VHDVAGRLVATLFDGVAEAGPHSVAWDGDDANGRLAPSGVYQCTLRTESGRQTRNLVLSR